MSPYQLGANLERSSMVDLFYWLTRRFGEEDYSDHTRTLEIGPLRLWYIPVGAYGDYPDRPSWQLEWDERPIAWNRGAKWLE